MPFFEAQRFYQIGCRAPKTKIVKSIEMRMENYPPIFLLFVQITFIEIAHSLQVPSIWRLRLAVFHDTEIYDRFKPSRQMGFAYLLR